MINSNLVQNAPALDAAQEQVVDNFFDQMEQVLNFGKGLRPGERRDIVKLVRQNLIFVREAMEAMDEIPELLPSYVDQTDIKDRFKFHEQLRTLEDKSRAFAEKVRDLHYLVGSKSWEDALTVYNAAKMATQNRVPKASYYYNLMARRFNGQGGISQGDGGMETDASNSETDDIPTGTTGQDNTSARSTTGQETSGNAPASTTGNQEA